MRIIVTLACLILTYGLNSQIVIDELFDDWDNEVLIADDTGDEFGNELGIDYLHVASDKEYIYFKVIFTKEINFQENQNFTIYIDIDNNANTGFKVNGIGSDLSYTPGFRSGFLNVGGGSINTTHDDIGLITAPTFSSHEFEFGIKRSESVSGTTYIMADMVKITSRVGGALTTDNLPDQNGGFEYELQNTEVPIDENYNLSKAEESDIRIVSFNSEFDGFFDGIRGAKQRSILSALDPDIIAFQEIYDHSANDVKDVIENILPLDNGEWYAEKIFPDIITVSKYPITEKHSINGNGVFNIQALEEPNKSLILFNCHFSCCDNNLERQEEIDELMSFVREMKESPGPITVQTDSPFIILGDLNLVGFDEQYKTLITGDIQDEFNYGADFEPDWDGSDMIDLKPRTIGYPSHFTWFDDGSSFPSGRLDYMIYSGYSAQVNNAFVFNTELMDTDILSQLSLSADIVYEASDHLPLVADYDFIKKVDFDQDGYTDDIDCDDTNPNINPGAEEVCDGTDNNCDGQIDEGLLTIYYSDMDMDGFGDPSSSTEACDIPPGMTENDLDCDDTNPNINPDAEDIPNNGIDENCDGMDAVSSIDYHEELKFKLFPNPVSDILEISSEHEIDRLEVFSLGGELLMKSKFSEKIDVSFLPDGLFIIKLFVKDTDNIIGVEMFQHIK